MNSHYPQDLSALADRPDFNVPSAQVTHAGMRQRVRHSVFSFFTFVGATLAVALVLFVPVFVYNLSRIEALEIAGEYVPASVFVNELGALFWGTAIVALAFTSLITGFLLAATGATIRPRTQPLGREDALTHLTVLRLSRSER